MKKRFIAGMMSVALMGAMALPVGAAATDSQTMQLTASVEPTFTLTIPAKTDIDFNSTSTNLNGTLKVTGNVLSNQKVTVTATANALHNEHRIQTFPIS